MLNLKKSHGNWSLSPQGQRPKCALSANSVIAIAILTDTTVFGVNSIFVSSESKYRMSPAEDIKPLSLFFAAIVYLTIVLLYFNVPSKNSFTKNPFSTSQWFMT
ncbi:MAG: hypothetical protein ANIMEMIM_00260 [Candidatus Argoarchaeum ethanivorans]|uniref:Uncharacterized protein n=1 Tax=Candidatus Argoarchaeum ethanivorans TaxID=2608793 RepID=A0A811T4F2_9EURY|nr:MAG: hypothetical protein ANIMEMIM_00260 [Candidatus Argoarchaeum ethanivorans]